LNTAKKSGITVREENGLGGRRIDLPMLFQYSDVETVTAGVSSDNFTAPECSQKVIR
jgi:hypothetical protein